MLVSLYNFLLSLKKDKFDGPFSKLVDHFLNDKLYYGSWAEHVDQFVNLSNVHVIYYETLIKVKIKIISLKILI